jgi:hypothetical protein
VISLEETLRIFAELPPLDRLDAWAHREVPAAAELRRPLRDTAIAEFDRIFYRAIAAYRAANEMSLELSRYFRRSWKIDRECWLLLPTVPLQRKLGHRIIRFNRESVPSFATLRRVIEENRDISGN